MFSDDNNWILNHRYGNKHFVICLGNAYRTDMGLSFESLEPNRGLLVNRTEVDDSINPNLSKQR